MIETTLSILSGTIAALVAAIGAWLAKRRSLGERRRFTEELNRLTKERFEVGLSFGPVSVSKLITGDQTASPLASAGLLMSFEKQIAARVAASPGLTKEEVQAEIDKQFFEFQECLSKIESRFPDNSQIEKIVSINDALLAERIGQLSKQMEFLEKRMLSKWDVAFTVSSIIAGIGFVVGATYAIIRFMGKSP